MFRPDPTRPDPTHKINIKIKIKTKNPIYPLSQLTLLPPPPVGDDLRAAVRSSTPPACLFTGAHPTTT
jgi:hypothetical protein